MIQRHNLVLLLHSHANTCNCRLLDNMGGIHYLIEYQSKPEAPHTPDPVVLERST